MPAKSGAQRRAMQAAAHGRSKLGIPKSVAQKFLKHKSPDSYNDTALGETPPREKYSREQERGSDPMGRAAGRPGAVVESDGVDNLRADGQTFEAGDNRPKSSSLKRRQPAAGGRYNYSTV